MASNTLPTNSGQLIGLAQQMVTGINTVGASVPIVMVTAAQIQSALDLFSAQDSAYNAQRSAGQLASGDFQAAMDAIYGWLLSCTNVLANSFGTKWNTQWAQAGFTNQSTGVPSRQADRLGLTLSLVNFFTANPSYEVPSQNVTAAQGTTLRTAALTAQAAVNAATATLNALGTTWQSAYDALVKLMTELLKNLEAKLAKDDPRWLRFGLQKPATITTPGQPQNLSANLDQTGAIIVQCDPVPTATRYRWRTLLAGIQINYQLAASTPGPMGALSGFVPGQAVQIIVQAVNAGLQSVASEPILFTVPPVVVSRAAAVQGEAKVVVAAPSEKVVATNGNGHHRNNGQHEAAPARI